MSELQGLKNAWLSPEGEVITDAPDFYPGGGGWHEGLAGCIVMKLRGLRTTYEAHEFAREGTPHAYTYEYLESIGWVRLCGWGVILKWVLPCGTVLTGSQKTVIEKWCSENGVDWGKTFDVCGRDCCTIPVK